MYFQRTSNVTSIDLKLEQMRLSSIIYERVLERCRNIAFDRAETAEQRRVACQGLLRSSLPTPVKSPFLD